MKKWYLNCTRIFDKKPIALQNHNKNRKGRPAEQAGSTESTKDYYQYRINYGVTAQGTCPGENFQGGGGAKLT